MSTPIETAHPELFSPERFGIVRAQWGARSATRLAASVRRRGDGFPEPRASLAGCKGVGKRHWGLPNGVGRRMMVLP